MSQADDKALHSPFRSGIEVDEYHLDPVVRALSMPRVNLLIADEVGLGKIIEAGLVVQEMILRHRVRSVLIICPSSLQAQWQEEMRDKFGLEFRIIDSESISQLRRKRGIHVNPWSHFPRLITSIEFRKGWAEWVRQPLLWLDLPDPATSVFDGMATDPDRETLGRLMHAIYKKKCQW